MMEKAEFKNKYIKRMSEMMERYEPWMEFAATAGFEMYKEDPEDLTPEGHAEAEVDEWRHNI